MASLAAGADGPKSIEDLGAVVTGVNDTPPEGEDLFAHVDGTEDQGVGATSVASAPVPAAMLADQRAREAKYGTGVSASPAVASADQHPSQPAMAPNGRPIIIDASEGTKLDPLLNKTYDLSYAKDVPNLSAPR